MAKLKRVIKAFTAFHHVYVDIFSTDDGFLRIQKYDETAPDTMTDEDAVHQVRLLAIRGNGEASALLELHGLHLHTCADQIEEIGKRWEKLGVEIFCPEEMMYLPEDREPMQWNDEQLAQVIAQQCYFTRQNFDDEFCNHNAPTYETALEGLSYCVSRLLEENTVDGNSGVDSDVCFEWLKDLSREDSYAKVVSYARKLVEDHGGAIAQSPATPVIHPPVIHPPVIHPAGPYVCVKHIEGDGDAIRLPNGNYVVLGFQNNELGIGLSSCDDDVDAWVATIDRHGVTVMPNSGSTVELTDGLKVGDKLGG